MFARNRFDVEQFLIGRINRHFDLFLDNEELWEITKRGDANIEELNPSEFDRYVFITRRFWNIEEAAFTYFSSGVLSAEAYEPWATAMCPEYAITAAQGMLEDRTVSLRRSFTDYLEKSCQ